MAKIAATIQKTLSIKIAMPIQDMYTKATKTQTNTTTKVETTAKIILILQIHLTLMDIIKSYYPSTSSSSSSYYSYPDQGSYSYARILSKHR